MPRFRFLISVSYAFVTATFLTACSEPKTPPVEQASQDLVAAAAGKAPAGRFDDVVAPGHYRIELRIDPRQENFSGVTEIDVTFKEPRDQVWLHGKNLQVTEAWLSNAEGDRIEAGYEEKLESGVALLTLAETVGAGGATLHFRYSAPFNTSTNAMFKVVRGEDSYAATQFEPIAARQVFPGFDDPGFKVPFDLALVTLAGDVAITTTPEKSIEMLDDGFVRRTFETTRPLPTYLLAFAVGPYDLVDHGSIPANDIRDREIALRGLTARGMGERMEYALEHTDGLLTTLEEYFGTPYPYRKLDLIAVPESFGGAMENVGAITYDEWLILMDEDSPLDQRRAYTTVHAHEMAHMWFGNLVTPDWWTDIWLNESFATWMMNKTADTYWPEGQFDRATLKGALGAMTNDSLAAAREIREPIDHNDRISGAFDGITYQKGGGVLAMLERYVGENEFRKGIQLHMNRHADGTANADDFIASVAEGSGASEIDAAFKSFINQPGVPLVSTEVVCAEGQQPRLEVSQARYAPLGSSIDGGSSEWLIPMCVSYDAEGGRKSTCAMLRESRQTIRLESENCPGLVHPNADGAGYYRFSMPQSWMDSLVAGASSLSAPEALVLTDSLDASFLAGEAQADSFVNGMAALLNHPDWDVAESAMNRLESITQILSAEEMKRVYPSLQSMVKPRYEALEGATDEGSRILRQRMQRFLIVIARDRDMRKPLAEQAAARIGLNGEPDLSAVPVDEMETVLSVGVQDLGEPFFDLLLAQGVASEDPEFRNSAFGALARVEDPVLAAKLHAAILGGDFKGTEFLGIVFRQMVRKATTNLTYQWIRKNDVAVIEMIPNAFRSNTVPALGSSFCSLDKAAEWEAFVNSHADMIPGYERNLAQATETIRLCAALKQAQGADLLAALQELPVISD
jgi:alanyl aminopeptidase